MLILQGGAGLTGPGDPLARPVRIQDGAEEIEAFVEQQFIVLEIETEQREGFDEGAATQGDLRAVVGDRIHGGPTFEDAHRIIGGQHGHRGGHLQPFGLGQDRGHHDVRRGDGVVGAVVFTETDEINTDLLREYGLVDDVTQGLGMGDRIALKIHGSVTEGVDAEGDLPGGGGLLRHVSGGLSWACSGYSCGYINNIRGKMFPGPFSPLRGWGGNRSPSFRDAGRPEQKTGTPEDGVPAFRMWAWGAPRWTRGSSQPVGNRCPSGAGNWPHSVPTRAGNRRASESPEWMTPLSVAPWFKRFVFGVQRTLSSIACRPSTHAGWWVS
ncbi:hypothetical protein [Corynebacterium efficiens YS-314]|uniref:Uncharacterized protein n=1 Tax=Corynebacterium efficiens (strain DSM 44549 / YS-314 / AJ 12310 / JCM 11189 / NBRC 100395) TaxID=196164 RepID=Q8FNX3_COREF|nr:hypothetical protein [Corynebacterium efficiens YS-314]